MAIARDTGRPVVGVDGCRGGWVAAMALPRVRSSGPPVLRREERLADVLTWASEAGAAIVGVDIPIGLPERGQLRTCDLEARRRLGAGASRVFLTPAREVVATWAASAGQPLRERCAAARGVADVPGRGLSAQTAGILDKVVEADALARAQPDGPATGGPRLVEVHPELSWAAMSATYGGDGRALPPKRSWPGISRRLAVLGAAYPDLDLATVRDDDEADALAVAWSAARVAAGTSEHLPGGPAPRDAVGLPMRIAW